MSVFSGAVLPVLLVFIIGFIIQKIKKVDIKSISTLSVYVLIPALVFRSIFETDFKQQHLILIVVVLVLTFTTILINKIIVRVKNLEQNTESAFILSTVFMNAGNYGSPIVLFVFGEEAFHYAISFYVLQIILFNTVGVYYASRNKENLKEGILNIFKLPAIYAVVIALIIKQFPSILPDNLMNSISLLADGAIPTIMLLLGMQIANLKFTTIDWKMISYVTILRLIVSPLIVLILVMFLPIDPLYRNVLLIQASMPTAVNATLYSIEFNANPKFVSVVTLYNTMFSLLTVPILLNILS